MKLRKLNDEGIRIFKDFLEDQKNSSLKKDIPSCILEDVNTSEGIDEDFNVDENKRFGTRYEMGEYLVDLLGDINSIPRTFIGNKGVWNWLTLLWFDQLCPLRNGKAKMQDSANFVLSNEFGRRQRHAIFGTWNLVSRYGLKSRFMISKPAHERGHINEVICGTQGLIEQQAVIELAYELYSTSDSFKASVTSRKVGGNIERYVQWVGQVGLTIDLVTITKDKLKERLPKKEYKRWLA